MNSSRARAARLTVAGVLAATILAACGGSGGSDRDRQGGTLRLGTDVDVEATDNIQIRITTDRQVMGSTVYEPLFTADPKGSPTPALAIDSKGSADNKVWTLTLQKGVKFQNGDAFTAEDVKANFDTIFDPDEASSIAGDFSNIASVEAVDDTTVRFTLKNPNNNFPASITDYPLIGDMDARAKMGKKKWVQNPIGTGPYKWEGRTVGDEVTFTRFEGYWRGKPPLDRVVVKVIPEPNVATLALQNGDLDVITNNQIEVEALGSLRSDPNLQVITVESNTLYHAWTNFGAPRVKEYDDVLAMHQGLAHLFNAEKIVPAIVGEFGVYANQEIPEWQPGHDPSLEAYPYDPQKGIDLLTKAGFPPGSELRFVVINAPLLCKLATAIQSQIKELGYKVDLKCSDAESTGVGPNYQWDVVFNRSSGRADAATYFHDRWDIGLADAKDDKNTFADQRLQSLIETIPTQPTPEKSATVAQEAGRYVVRDQAAIIPLFFANSWVVANKNVHGLVLSNLGWQSFLMNDYTKVTLGGDS